VFDVAGSMPEKSRVKLYWGDVSQPARGYKAFLTEAGIPHEEVHVNLLKGEHKSAVITDVNPKGTIPFATIDGKSTVYNESAASMKLVADLYPSKTSTIYPTDPYSRYLVDRALDFQGADFRPAFMKCIMMKFAASGGKPLDQATWETNKANVYAKIGALNQMLDDAGTRFLCGNYVTLADFVIFAEY
jgi:glutathione S-transferase